MVEMTNEFTVEESLKIKEEFKRINDNIYLDHGGTALYSEKQIDNVAKLLKDNLFCNPHTCKITGDLVDQVRYRVLNYFNTDPENYAIIFLANASAALKTVAECFNFGSTGSFYHCQENHTSVLGMREIVQTNNIFVLTKDELVKNLELDSKISEKYFTGNSLVAFSAQCNLSGYKMPLDIIKSIQTEGLKIHGKCIRGDSQNSLQNNKFYICLDAASFAATNFLDLTKYNTDFVCISFYKMFGYPTGLGALIVSKRGQTVLKKKYFGGGTVKISMARKDYHVMRDGFNEQFEDGTLSFLGIASLLEGFKTIERLIPCKNGIKSQQRISNHVFNLAKYFYESLKNLKHSNGQNLIEFYNHTNYKSYEIQGGFVCFNILHDDGSYVGFAEVACIAAVHNIILRTGCFCNAGTCQTFLELKDEDIIKHFEAGHVCSDYNDLIDGQPTGGIRASFGFITQKNDVDALINMITKCYLTKNLHERLELITTKDLPKALSHIPYRLINESVQLKRICIYPIKSCASFDITGKAEWEITANGFKFDRVWMIVDSNGMAITQKHNSNLCLIKPFINLLSNKLELTFNKNKKISIPLEIETHEKKSVTTNFCQSKVCGDSIKGFDCGDEIAKWLSDVLDIPGLRLFRKNNNFERKNKDGSSKEINLSNQAQFLLINQLSVEWLSKKVQDWDNENDKNLNGIIKRFRANLIIETYTPFEENDFETLKIGNVEFISVGPCTRCQMICIDQNTGNKTSEPLKTIAKELKGKIRFGIYLSQKNVQENSSEKISCEDKIIFTKKE